MYTNLRNRFADWMSARPESAGELTVLLLVLAAAFVLRFNNLGNLGLYGDEDYTYFATKSILENGIPTMPSGMIYIRGIFHLGLTTLSSLVFGLSEFSLRLPSVLANLAVIYLLYVLAREISSVRAALVASAIYALSAWDIEMSRFARMYEIFLVLYLASTLSFYLGFLRDHRGYRVTTAVLIIVASIIHSLGVFLLMLPISLLIVKKYDIVSRWTLLGYIAVIGVISRAYSAFIDGFYAGSINEVIITKTVIIGPRPDFTLLASLFSTAGSWLPYVIGILALAVGTLLLWRLSRFARHIPPEALFAAVAMSMACLAQQMHLAFWLLIYALFSSNQGFAALRLEPYRGCALFFVTTGAIWFAYGMFSLGVAGGDMSLLASIKNVWVVMFDYPFVTTRQIFGLAPVVTILALVQLGIALHRSSVRATLDNDWLLVVGALGPITAFGFFADWPYIGYLFMAYPFFVIAAAILLHAFLNRVFARIFGSRYQNSTLQWLGIIAPVLLISLVSAHHSPGVAMSISQRDYATDVRDIDIFEYTRHPDHKTPALFVQQNLKPEDIVITMDFISTAYMDRIDYILRSEGLIRSGLQLERDIYSGRPAIRDLDMLRDVFQIHNDRRIWLITSHEFLGPHLDTPILSDDLFNFLTMQQEHVVDTGADGVTQVFLWEPENRVAR